MDVEDITGDQEWNPSLNDGVYSSGTLGRGDCPADLEKEICPVVESPGMGSAVIFWSNALASLQQVPDRFGNDLYEDDLHLLEHPHPNSGQ